MYRKYTNFCSLCNSRQPLDKNRRQAVLLYFLNLYKPLFLYFLFQLLQLFFELFVKQQAIYAEI